MVTTACVCVCVCVTITERDMVVTDVSYHCLSHPALALVAVCV